MKLSRGDNYKPLLVVADRCTLESPLFTSLPTFLQLTTFGVRLSTSHFHAHFLFRSCYSSKIEFVVLFVLRTVKYHTNHICIPHESYGRIHCNDLPFSAPALLLLIRLRKQVAFTNLTNKHLLALWQLSTRSHSSSLKSFKFEENPKMRFTYVNNELAVASCLLFTVAMTGALVCNNNLAPSDYKVLGLEKYGADGKRSVT